MNEDVFIFSVPNSIRSLKYSRHGILCRFNYLLLKFLQPFYYLEVPVGMTALQELFGFYFTENIIEIQSKQTFRDVEIKRNRYSNTISSKLKWTRIIMDSVIFTFCCIYNLINPLSKKEKKRMSPILIKLIVNVRNKISTTGMSSYDV